MTHGWNSSSGATSPDHQCSIVYKPSESVKCKKDSRYRFMLIFSGHERNKSILDLLESTDEHQDPNDFEIELSKAPMYSPGKKNSHMQNDVSGVLACLLHRFADKSRLMPRKTSWPVTVAIVVKGDPAFEPLPEVGGVGSCRQAGKIFRTLKFSESFGQRYWILALRLDIKTQKCENLT